MSGRRDMDPFLIGPKSLIRMSRRRGAPPPAAAGLSRALLAAPCPDFTGPRLTPVQYTPWTSPPAAAGYAPSSLVAAAGRSGDRAGDPARIIGPPCAPPPERPALPSMAQRLSQASLRAPAWVQAGAARPAAAGILPAAASVAASRPWALGASAADPWPAKSRAPLGFRPRAGGRSGRQARAEAGRREEGHRTGPERAQRPHSSAVVRLPACLRLGLNGCRWRRRRPRAARGGVCQSRRGSAPRRPPLPTSVAPTQMRTLPRCRDSGDRGCPRALLPRPCERATGPVRRQRPSGRRSGRWLGMRLARPRQKKYRRHYYIDRTTFGIKCH